MPTVINRTIAESGGDYASLNAAEAALPASLVAADEQWNFTITGTWSAADTTNVVVNPTTDATRYVSITADSNSRSTMPYGSTHYRHEVTKTDSTAQLTIESPYTRLFGYAGTVTQTTNSAYANVIRISAASCLIDSCFLRGRTNFATQGVGTAYPMLMLSGSAGTEVRNTYGEVIIDNQPSAVIGIVAKDNVSANNVTFVGNEAEATVRQVNDGFEINGAGKTFTVTNCLSDCGNPTVQIPSAYVGDFQVVAGSFGGDYNASFDTTAPGANSRTSQTFTYENAASGDYHLDPTDTGARTFGTNLSGSFTVDFDGQTRVNWDIGADEVPSGGDNLFLFFKSRSD